MFDGLGRGIDIRLLSNRILLIGFLVSLAACFGVAVVGDHLTYGEAVNSSLSIAVAWMIGRELDPDHVHVATLAMVLAGVGVFVAVPSALIAAAAMLTLRMTTGTVGHSLTVSDLLLIGVVGWGSGGTLWAWPIGLVCLVWLKNAPEVGPLRWWGVVVLAGSFIGAFGFADLQAITVEAATLALAGAVAVVAAVSIIGVSTVSPTDRNRGELHRRRLRLSRLAGGGYLIVAALVGGLDAFWTVAPVAAGVAAAAVSSIVLVVRRLGATEAAQG